MFASTLRSTASPRKAARVQIVREEVEECVELVAPALLVMSDSNRDLGPLFAELDQLLGPPARALHPSAAKEAAAPAADPPSGAVERAPAAKN